MSQFENCVLLGSFIWLSIGVITMTNGLSSGYFKAFDKIQDETSEGQPVNFGFMDYMGARNCGINPIILCFVAVGYVAFCVILWPIAWLFY